MFNSPLQALPDGWKVDLTILRSGGRDLRRVPRSGIEIPLRGCLVAPGGSAEPDPNSNQPKSRRTIYAPAGAMVLNTDRVRFPDGTEWDVTGDPGIWPLGTTVEVNR